MGLRIVENDGPSLMGTKEMVDRIPGVPVVPKAPLLTDPVASSSADTGGASDTGPGRSAPMNRSEEGKGRSNITGLFIKYPVMLEGTTGLGGRDSAFEFPKGDGSVRAMI